MEYEDLEPVSLKGKSAPVGAWLAKALRAPTGARPTHVSATPFVGREIELDALMGLFRECVESGVPRSALIVGEPGIGKSRLVAEFGAYVHGLPDAIVWRAGRCLPYGDGVTFWALGEVVKQHAGVLEGDDTVTLERKLRRSVPDGEDAAWVRRRLRPLLGLTAPESTRDENFVAWRTFLNGLAMHAPAVVVFEDLHWADEPMVAFLAETLRGVSDVPFLLVATARPTLFERHATAASLDFSRRLDLTSLEALETERLVASMLAVDVAPAEITQLVAERCGGNPLYAEELVRLLGERGALEGEGETLSLRPATELPVSGSIQALIAARLDALPPASKAALADASVVGRVFWAGAVSAIGGRDPADVGDLLADLAQRQLVRPTGGSSGRGEDQFEFWHALTRDVAYAQLTRAARARRHAAVLEWVKAGGAGRVEDLAEILAHHASTALDLARAAGDGQLAARLPADVVRFSALAGDRAMALDVAAAERFYGQAVEVARPGSVERHLFLARFGRALLMRGQLRKAGESLEVAVAGLRAAGEDRAAAVAMRTLSVVLLHLDDPRHKEVAAESVALLEGKQPTPELVTALLGQVGERVMDEDHAGTVLAADRAIEVARELGMAEPAEAFAFRGGARCDLGDAGGLDDYRRALDAADAQGLAIEAANITCNLGVSVFGLEGPKEALAIHRQGRESARRHGMGFLVRACRMQELDDLVWAGEWREALEEADDLARRLESEENEFDLVLMWSQQLLLRVWMGEAGAVAALADGVVADVASTDQPVLAAYGLISGAAARMALGQPGEAAELLAVCAAVPRIKGCADYVCRLPEAVRVAAAAGDVALVESLVGGVEPAQPLHAHALAGARARLREAEGRTAEAAATAAASAWHRFGVPYEEAQSLLCQARCLAALGRAPEAAACLGDARAIFSRLGARPALDETQALLARLRG